jgi:hypothetical protein
MHYDYTNYYFSYHRYAVPAAMSTGNGKKENLIAWYVLKSRNSHVDCVGELFFVDVQ